MIHSKQLNNPINKIHERGLKTSFNELLELDNPVAIHQTNLAILEIMKEVFETKEPCDNFFSEVSHLKRKYIKSTHYNIPSVQYL